MNVWLVAATILLVGLIPCGVVMLRGASPPSTRNIGAVLTATWRSDALRNSTSDSAAIKSGSADASVSLTPSWANSCSA